MPRVGKSRSTLEKWYVRAFPIALGAGAVGVVMGFIINLFLGAVGHNRPSVLAQHGAAFFLGTYLVMAIVELAGGAAARLYGGSPFSVAPPDFSYPESLAARGEYDAAVAAYRHAAEEHPASLEPLLRAARVLRDDLGRHDEAIATFRAARAHPAADEAVDAMVTREIAEIHETRLRQPARALPELARLIERYPDSAAADWARRRMEELKRAVWTEETP